MNEGKKFEEDFKKSCISNEIFILRLNDTSLSWVKEKQAAFTPENPCDFLVYQKPYLFALELKSTHYNSISIQRDPTEDKKMIKAHQINSLVKFSLIDGVYAGLIFNFRNDEDINNNETYWLSIANFSNFLQDSDKKSINKGDIVLYGGIKLKQTLKRTRFCYDIKDLIDNISKEGGLVK